ncbi:hypothetical protein [Janthinobacterium sp. BJB301]|uniref:hypothetical protein n=1 Tax=Janthinobacterium sp. BJB301 TaxID=1560195 RepID=UPI00117BCDF0|nr:hypothetical protein [Janthinobacterium sp. BJB301]
MTRPNSILAPVIPPALRRAGILRVVDNVPAGSSIGNFEAEFVRLFAKIIQKKLFTSGERNGLGQKQLAAVDTGSGQHAAGTEPAGSRRRLRAMRSEQSCDAIRPGDGSAIDRIDPEKRGPRRNP